MSYCRADPSLEQTLTAQEKFLLRHVLTYIALLVSKLPLDKERGF